MSEKTPFGVRSYPFAVGRVRVRESSLLDKTQWNRLLEGDEESALQALREYGYGASGHETRSADSSIDELIAAELSDTAAFIAEITPDQELTDMFLLPTDAHNLKALLKARLLGTPEIADAILIGGGTLPVALLNACVAYEDLSVLPKIMEEELEGIWDIENPRILSARVDRAVFAQATGLLEVRKSPYLCCYFLTWIKYLNLLSAQRGLRLGWKEEEISAMLIKEFPVKESVQEMLPEIHSGETLSETEKNMNQALLSVMREARDDSFGIAPIVCYLLNKRNEARNLRVLFAAKRSGLPISEADLDI